ncbi:hypothetical protein L083_4208 [Actinoplanes sp. N902-109]|nr:hypothetical protein L083_4208 [Actinoplanes sp. N902-109]
MTQQIALMTWAGLLDGDAPLGAGVTPGVVDLGVGDAGVVINDRVYERGADQRVLADVAVRCR